MMDEKKPRVPVCPSCGQPVPFGFLRFRISDKVIIWLALLLIGYFILSLLILAAISPVTGAGRGCRRYDYIHKPDHCKDTEFKLSVRPLNDDPAFRVFVGVGLAMGPLVFYWDWLQSLYENRRRKQGKAGEKDKKRYTCRHCGRQWG